MKLTTGKKGNLMQLPAAIVCCVAFSAPAWGADTAPSREVRKSIAKETAQKKPSRPVAKLQPEGAQYGALQGATRNESRKFDQLSRSSKDRHSSTANSKENQR